jgi:hypothetical protein
VEEVELPPRALRLRRPTLALFWPPVPNRLKHCKPPDGALSDNYCRDGVGRYHSREKRHGGWEKTRSKICHGDGCLRDAKRCQANSPQVRTDEDGRSAAAPRRGELLQCLRTEHKARQAPSSTKTRARHASSSAKYRSSAPTHLIS